MRMRHFTTLADWRAALCGERGLDQGTRTFYEEDVTCPHCEAILRYRRERSDAFTEQVARQDATPTPEG